MSDKKALITRSVLICSLSTFVLFIFSAIKSTVRYHRVNQERIQSAWVEHNGREEAIVEKIETKLGEIAAIVDEILVQPLKEEKRSEEQIRESLRKTFVSISGYIWQKYTDVIHDGISRGFEMPESQSANIEMAYKERFGDQELVSWKFRVVLHKKFNYAMYPFDRENLKIRLWHEDFYQNAVLVPDLISYKTITPESWPGLLKNMVLPSWEIQKSFFSYKRQSYKTSFGLLDYTGLTDFPELQFNISLRKLLIGPFMAHILPIMVILFTFFAIIMLSTDKKERIDLLDAKTMKVITACAGIFLVVIFSHIRLRESLEAKGLVYLEFFYFIIYILIILVPINSYLASTRGNRWIHYRENLLIKHLFWPASQLALLLITLWKFY